MRFLTLFTFFLMTSWSQVHASDTLISTSWSLMNRGQIQCLKMAGDVLWFNKFEQSKDHGAESAWASNGDYKALVGCVAEKGMAFFVVVGPNGKKTREIVDKISADFRGEMGIIN
ncbi:MAG: hypothetical protein VSS52_008250 [Thiotrichaceae bacterium]|nr:hypothetical protein [Thiotrichaceae bacterium]